jgi:hypothetical protein
LEYQAYYLDESVETIDEEFNDMLLTRLRLPHYGVTNVGHRLTIGSGATYSFGGAVMNNTGQFVTLGPGDTYPPDNIAIHSGLAATTEVVRLDEGRMRR